MLIRSVAFRQSAAFSDCPDGSIPELITKPGREAATHTSLPTAQTQRFAGKKVSLRRRQQADTPNHCSTWHKSIKILLWYASNCNALRAAIAGLSYCLQFLRLRSGSYCVLHATSFITSFVSLHYTSFVAIHLLHGRAAR